VKAEGFEPSTACLEGRCSIQLSYASILVLKLKWKKVYLVGVAGFEPAASCSQSRRDNRATLHPEKNYFKNFFDNLFFEKMKNNKSKLKKRRVRDSNPWYSFPYACLANMSFRPLRQLSKLNEHIPFKRLQM
jgi:hypothetical protein